MNRIIALFASIALLIVSFSAAYYFLIYIPQKDERELALKLTEQEQKDKITLQQEREKDDEEFSEALENWSSKQEYDECVQSAWDTYLKNWNNECVWNSLGVDPSGQSNCLLPQSSADRWERINKDAVSSCEKIYL